MSRLCTARAATAAPGETPGALVYRLAAAAKAARAAERHGSCLATPVVRDRLDGALAGVISGLLATGAMSVVMLIGRGLGLTGELPPERIGHRALDLVVRRPSAEAAAVAATALHFAFGAFAGGLLGALLGRARSRWLHVPAGVAYGTGIWAVNYLGWIPALGLMPIATRDRPGRVWVMLVAHWIYGAAASVIQARLVGEPKGSEAGGRRGLFHGVELKAN